LFADYLVVFPARIQILFIRTAESFYVLGALSDFPAWCILEKFLDPFYADFLVMDQIPEAREPSYIIIGIIAMHIFTRRVNKAVFFVIA
jgi:hypothetical protein